MSNPLGHWFGDQVPKTPEPFLGTPVAGSAARKRGAGGLGEQAVMQVAAEHPVVLAAVGIFGVIGAAVWALLKRRSAPRRVAPRPGRGPGRVMRLPPA